MFNKEHFIKSVDPGHIGAFYPLKSRLKKKIFNSPTTPQALPPKKKKKKKKKKKNKENHIANSNTEK